MKARTQPIVKRVAIYIRVSTEEQAREGVSLDAQEDRARAYCQLAGLVVHRVYRDAGVSAGDPLEIRPEGRRCWPMSGQGWCSMSWRYDLRFPPGNELEALKGDRKGQHSIRINDQYLVCFRWTGDGAEDVESTDYH